MAPLFFSAFLSRAILDFWALPPPISALCPSEGGGGGGRAWELRREEEEDRDVESGWGCRARAFNRGRGRRARAGRRWLLWPPRVGVWATPTQEPSGPSVRSASGPEIKKINKRAPFWLGSASLLVLQGFQVEMETQKKKKGCREHIETYGHRRR